ncbi:MAG: YfhO family protein [Chloroflexi bacterium]|nr:YfhO family protein [Chloroflexota bacterium]
MKDRQSSRVLAPNPETSARPPTAWAAGRALLAWAGLAAATLAIVWPLGLTNRVLAGVDALTYFTPYWAHRMTELAAGHAPLWNPYLFLGAPFLANPQAAVLYPLHWPLSWLSPAQALVWSALLHVWLAAGFAYTFGRRSLRLGRPAAWLAGLLFGMGGFTLARVENINQLNTLAWLPALLWLLDECAAARDWRGRMRWGAALSVGMALQLLAGHTQTAFINLVGLALYAGYPVGEVVYWYIGGLVRRYRPQLPGRSAGAPVGRLAPLAAIIPALLLSAAQLLPTLELNGLGLRTAGLAYRQAVSFSLRPRLLAQTFLPSYRGGLAQVFGSEGYAEFIGYVGIVGLALAAAGVVALWRPRSWRGDDEQPPADAGSSTPNPIPPRRGPRPAAPLALLAAVGVFLALGAYNPFYYLLWRFAPGFDLFRAPVRWLALYAIGVAGLAGFGFDVWLREIGRRSHVIFGGRLHGVRLILIVFALLELWFAARALPFAQATAPAALGLRNAPAALLAATAYQPPAGRDRFLSLSDIRFDPGDLAELRDLQAALLPADAVERYVRAAKQMEVIAPNLSLLLRLPAVDGYDGGMLPTARYGELQTLFLPPELRLPDGRLREQLRQIPDGRLLDLTGVRFVITDKQNDLWADDVYYDLEQAAILQPAEMLRLDLNAYPRFSATHVGVVAHLEAATAAGAEPVAELLITDAQDQTFALSLPVVQTTGRPSPVRVSLPRPVTPTAIAIRVLPQAPAPVVLRGLSLIDGRTAAHTAITVSPRGDFRRIHTGDVKVYERTNAAGRAWLVHGAVPAADDEAALALLAASTFDPRVAVVLAGDAAPRPPAPVAENEAVAVASFEPERIVLRVVASAPGHLVLADAFYPGWQATVDGVAVPILRANLLLRAVALEPGAHEVVFVYRPASWRWGVAISIAALGLLAAVLAATTLRAARPLR